MKKQETPLSVFIIIKWAAYLGIAGVVVFNSVHVEDKFMCHLYPAETLIIAILFVIGVAVGDIIEDETNRRAADKSNNGLSVEEK